MNEATTFAHGEIDGDSDEETITYVIPEEKHQPTTNSKCKFIQ